MSVRVRPELGQEPVEVVMMLNPPYEIRISNDSTVSLETVGVLGATYADQYCRRVRPPGPNAVLKTQTTEQMTAQQFLEFVVRLWKRRTVIVAPRMRKPNTLRH